MSGKRCELCKFFQVNSVTEGYGRCKLNPPSPINNTWDFPEVTVDDYCWQFERVDMYFDYEEPDASFIGHWVEVRDYDTEDWTERILVSIGEIEDRLRFEARFIDEQETFQWAQARVKARKSKE